MCKRPCVEVFEVQICSGKTGISLDIIPAPPNHLDSYDWEGLKLIFRSSAWTAVKDLSFIVNSKDDQPPASRACQSCLAWCLICLNHVFNLVVRWRGQEQLVAQTKFNVQNISQPQSHPKQTAPILDHPNRARVTEQVSGDQQVM